MLILKLTFVGNLWTIERWYCKWRTLTNPPACYWWLFFRMQIILGKWLWYLAFILSNLEMMTTGLLCAHKFKNDSRLISYWLIKNIPDHTIGYTVHFFPDVKTWWFCCCSFVSDQFKSKKQVLCLSENLPFLLLNVRSLTPAVLASIVIIPALPPFCRSVLSVAF